tara:strand:+ start:2026 stop:2652 length:627 start_codon:yes stop_codon:yes gene_type:complete
MNLNKAAMFGLDARIALAIFGALSVISGAALYSAIQTAKVESTRQGFEEILKAVDAFYLDNGYPIPQFNTELLYLSDIINNRQSLSSWNGPYINASVSGTYAIKNDITEKLGSTVVTYAYLQKDTVWSGSSARYPCTAVNNVNCRESLLVRAVSDTDDSSRIEELFNNMDSIIDNGDGANLGNIRFSDYGSSGNASLTYFGRKRLRTQ